MGVYKDFAYFYSKGSYIEFSAKLAQYLPILLADLKVSPETILDFACGEGTFAVAMAKQGFQVTGLDSSAEMLDIGQNQAQKDEVAVNFIHGDMRSLKFDQEFDLVTCWYDSLNYILEKDDLQKTFDGVVKALKRAGYFIFDMNTIYGLAVNWQRHPAYVRQESDELFEVHRPTYDYENNIATLTITGFRKIGDAWSRFEERHRQRGYSIDEITGCLNKAGLEEISCWGDIKEKSKLEPESGRVWFVTQKAI